MDPQIQLRDQLSQMTWAGELDGWLRRPEAEADAEALFDRLTTSQRLKLEAVEELLRGREQLRDAERGLAEAREGLEQARRAQPPPGPEAHWKAVTDELDGRRWERLGRDRCDRLEELMAMLVATLLTDDQLDWREIYGDDR